MFLKIKDVIGKLNGILTRKQKYLFWIVFVCAILAAVLETVGVSIIVPLVNVLLQPELLWENQIVKWVAAVLSLNSDNQLTVLIIVGVVLLYIIKNIFFVFYSWLKIKYACKVQRELAVDMMTSYMNRGYAFFLNHNFSEINQGVNVDVISLYNVVTNLLQGISQIAIVVFICAFMCYADWQLALGVIVAAGICLLMIFFVFRKRMLHAGKEIRKYNILAVKAFQEAVLGIKEVFVLRKQRHFINAFEKNTMEKQRAQVIQVVGTEIPAYIIEAICITGIMVILGVRMLELTNPEEFVAVLASFAVGAFRILPAIGKISVSINMISSSLPGMNSVYENLIEARQYADNFECVDVQDAEQYIGRRYEKTLWAHNISFSYPNSSERVLEKLNIEIPKGKSIALVGESGAGKSTLADILLGVLAPTEGTVFLDDMDIRNIPNLWSKTVGFVPQSIYLADASIRENVAFGISASDVDDNRVVDSLKKANLYGFVEELPNGILTEVGDRGVRLSGGQRQRIGIARALYHNPEILVLDEATSALDNDTEASVMEAIESLQGTITLIIIAHRLTTIRNCDKIYEIRDGKAVERMYKELI